MSSEHDEQVALFNILRMYEDKYPELKWVFAIPNGGHRHISVARKMKAEGVKAGVWDIYCPFPAFGYNGLWIEMKYGKNKLTTNQHAFRDDLGDLFRWEVCYTAEEACHAIGAYLKIEELLEI